jgi:hypothetical protein
VVVRQQHPRHPALPGVEIRGNFVFYGHRRLQENLQQYRRGQREAEGADGDFGGKFVEQVEDGEVDQYRRLPVLTVRRKV